MGLLPLVYESASDVGLQGLATAVYSTRRKQRDLVVAVFAVVVTSISRFDTQTTGHLRDLLGLVVLVTLVVLSRRFGASRLHAEGQAAKTQAVRCRSVHCVGDSLSDGRILCWLSAAADLFAQSKETW